MGIDSSTHPCWKNPFMQVRFFDTRTAIVGEYYDSIWRENGGSLPYPLNPFEIITNSKGSQACNEVKEAFTPELGSSYDFTKSKFEILHDVLVGRVKAADSTLHNFGVKSLKTYIPCRERSSVNGGVAKIRIFNDWNCDFHTPGTN